MDRVFAEEIVFHELHAACREGCWVFLGPDSLLGLLEDWCAVLDHEGELGI